jgi:DnaJ-class molecular chaperone
MSSEELKEKNTCQHCDGFGGQGCGYVPEQKGMLPSMCGYCDGTGVVNERKNPIKICPKGLGVDK